MQGFLKTVPGMQFQYAYKWHLAQEQKVIFPLMQKFLEYQTREILPFYTPQKKTKWSL